MENESRYPLLAIAVRLAKSAYGCPGLSFEPTEGELAAAERCAADLERWTEEGRQGLAVRDSEIARLYADLEAARKRIAELEAALTWLMVPTEMYEPGEQTGYTQCPFCGYKVAIGEPLAHNSICRVAGAMLALNKP